MQTARHQGCCLVAAMMAALVFMSCGPAGDGGAANSASADPGRLLTLVPELQIGGPDQEEILFNYVTDVQADADGRIFIGDSRDGIVRAFDADGNLLYSVAGRGQAPGQIPMAYQALAVHNDSLAVFDYRPVFVTFDRRDGAFRRKFDIPLDREVHGNASVVGASDFGLVLSVARRSGDNLQRHGTRDLRLLNESGLSEPFWSGSTREMLSYEPNDGSGAMSAFRAAPEGRHSLCAVSVTTLYCAENDSLAIDIVALRDDDDVRKSRYVLPFDPIAVTNADVAAWRAEMNNENFGDLLQPPEYWRPLRDLKTDDTGKLWLMVRVSRNDSVNTWWIADPETDYRARVELDANHRLQYVRDGKLYTSSKNEDGVPWATRFGFEYGQ